MTLDFEMHMFLQEVRKIIKDEKILNAMMTSFKAGYNAAIKNVKDSVVKCEEIGNVYMNGYKADMMAEIWDNDDYHGISKALKRLEGGDWFLFQKTLHSDWPPRLIFRINIKFVDGRTFDVINKIDNDLSEKVKEQNELKQKYYGEG